MADEEWGLVPCSSFWILETMVFQIDLCVFLWFYLQLIKGVFYELI